MKPQPNSRLAELAGLVQLLGGLQQSSGIDDISRLAALGLQEREQDMKQSFYDTGSALDRLRFDQSQHVAEQRQQMALAELALRQRAEERMQQQMNLSNELAKSGQAIRDRATQQQGEYYGALTENMTAKRQAEQQKLNMLLSLLGGGPGPGTAPTMSPAESQFLQQLQQGLSPQK